MTGQIPPYGENFRHDRVGSWHPVLNDTLYVLKRDNEWFIRSAKGSKQWWVFQGWDRDTALQHGKVQSSMTNAMHLLVDGIEGGFYELHEDVHAPDCGLQGSGLDKRCTCHVEAGGKNE